MPNSPGVSTAVAPFEAGAVHHLLLRIFAVSAAANTLLFIVNDVLTNWWGWPGPGAFLGQLGWFGFDAPSDALTGGAYALGFLQTFAYLGVVAAVAVLVVLTRNRSMRADSETLSAISAYIVRAAFWIVVIVGLVDMVISFMRVEELLGPFMSDSLISDLGRPSFRGIYVHFPLIAAALVIAYVQRSVSFSWLAILVVLAEVQIVISRFVFSYEQAFMGDLVRFWYAALFLFGSAHALVHDGHVRVDVLYVHFSKRGQAWSNSLGSALLGLPLCWVILGTGMAGKGSSINSPLLSFEISQSGYGMYVKYLMAGFLVVFAVSMAIQFTSYFLNSVADLCDEPDIKDEQPGAELVS